MLPDGLLDSFQSASGISLELLEKRFFLLHPPSRSSISIGQASPKGPAGFMIVCSCNVLSDHDVRNAVSVSLGPAAQRQADLWLPRLQRRMRPLRAHHQDHHRRSARPCAKACCSGCPHSHAERGNDEPDYPEFALAAS
jgi:bacterioferritin-associated ferredoxin